VTRPTTRKPSNLRRRANVPSAKAWAGHPTGCIPVRHAKEQANIMRKNNRKIKDNGE
jgi:hypothetical protein